MLNERFVDHLDRRFDREPKFQAVRNRCRILHRPVQDLPADEPYDLLVSGLPLNNFPVELVDEILAAFRRLFWPRRRAVVFRVRGHSSRAGDGQRAAGAGAAARHRPIAGQSAVDRRNSPRSGLAQFAAGLGASRAIDRWWECYRSAGCGQLAGNCGDRAPSPGRLAARLCCPWAAGVLY